MDIATREALLEHLVLQEGFSHADIHLTGRPRLLGRGWDNEMWEIGRLGPDAPRCAGARTVLRMPHRAIGHQLLRGEAQALALLEKHCPELPLARPMLIGSGGMEDESGVPFALQTWIEGELVAEIAAAELRQGRTSPAPGRPRSTQLASQLARALLALHRPAPLGYPRSPFRGVPLAARAGAVRREIAALEEVAPHLAHLAAVVRETWQRGMEAAVYDGEGVLLHGDPHPANLIALPGAQGLGLIDWGDTTVGDPASDLAYLLLLDPSGKALAEYGRARGRSDAALEARARAWAARHGTSLLLHEADPADQGHAALALLARAMLEAFAQEA